MKRKLIDFEVFKKIKDESLSASEAELIEAEDVLARALDLDGLSLHCFGDSDVTFETSDHSFVHATYRLAGNSIILENIEELVIDETAARKECRGLLNGMVEEILNNNDAKASTLFGQYLSLPTTRRSLMEGAVDFWVEKPGSKAKKSRGPQSPSDIAKRVKSKLKSQSTLPESEKRYAKQRRKGLKAQYGDDVRIHARFKKEPKHEIKASGKKFDEWAQLTENVAGYLDFQEFGPVMNQSEVQHDDKGNVVAVKIPTSQARNEGKILNLTYKHMLDTEIKCLRGKVKTVHEDSSFCHAMSDLRKTHALSDDTAMTHVLEAVVTKWPELLYLTHGELSKSIALALEFAGEVNYDDEMCDFLAEGILRTASSSYSERVNKVARLSGAQLDKEKTYESFRTITDKFYPALDEVTKLEMQVFVDLYNTLVEVHGQARKEGNEALGFETAEMLKELHSVLSEDKAPTLELAAEVAGWLAGLVEANVSGASHTWDVSNSTHQTTIGDHPRMNWAAKQHDAVPSNFPGDWGGKAPVSDGKSYKNGQEEEMRSRSWGNWGSDETWPALKNPYVPKPFGAYKMKGEEGAETAGQSDWSRWQSKDTWPNLQNPNIPDSPWDKGKYKMKSDNLVVDK